MLDVEWQVAGSPNKLCPYEKTMAVTIPAIDNGDCNNMTIESTLIPSWLKKLVKDLMKADILAELNQSYD